ncbi:alpha/beta hydrolase family protein [Myxococcus faecalis]|uniref:alpha/beta hydrolase family protein n=1 Tax=Myxococcus faecalis TaxID=3115646 RepID=UPI0038D1EA19
MEPRRRGLPRPHPRARRALPGPLPLRREDLCAHAAARGGRRARARGPLTRREVVGIGEVPDAVRQRRIPARAGHGEAAAPHGACGQRHLEGGDQRPDLLLAVPAHQRGLRVHARGAPCARHRPARACGCARLGHALHDVLEARRAARHPRQRGWEDHAPGPRPEDRHASRAPGAALGHHLGGGAVGALQVLRWTGDSRAALQAPSGERETEGPRHRLRPWGTGRAVREGIHYQELGNPQPQAAMLREISPRFHTEKIRKPLLVIQGAQAPRVPKARTDELVEGVRKNGVPVDYFVLPDDGHGFSSKKSEAETSARILSLLEQHLRRSGARPGSEAASE